MGSFYYISFSDSIENTHLIKDRIKQYSDCINFLDNNWFVFTEDKAEDIYFKLSKGEFEDDLIFVMRVDFSNYWGRLHKTIWEWIKRDRT